MNPVYPSQVPQPRYLAHPALLSVQPAGTSTRTAQKVYLHDVWVPVACTIRAFSIAHGAVAAGNIDLGIYDINGNLLVHTGVIPATPVNGTQLANLTTPYPIGPGVYYFGFWVDNATDSYFARQNLDPTQAWSDILGLSGSSATGLPPTFASLGGTVNNDVFVPFMANIQGGL